MALGPIDTCISGPMRRALLLLTLVLLFAGGFGCTQCSKDDPDGGVDAPQAPLSIREGGTERPDALIFAVTPSLSDTELRARYLPIAEYVAKQVGLPIEWRVLIDYAEMQSALTRYEVHLAVMSPFSYVEVKRQMPSLILIAVPVAGGVTTYSGYIVVREDGGFNSIADLKGRRFGFVDEFSASGYLYPLAYLRSQKIDPSSYFSETMFLGDHTRLLTALTDGRIDAGASFAIALSRPEGRPLKILAKTGRIPLDPWCASPRLDQELIDGIRGALVALSTRTEEGRQILNRTETNGFQVVGDDHYDGVRGVYRNVHGEGAPD